MPPMDASTPVCPMIAPNAPLSHIAPCTKLRSLQSIYPSSRYRSSAPALHTRPHISPALCFTTQPLQASLVPHDACTRLLALPVTITSTVCPIGTLPVPLSVHHASGSVDLYCRNVLAWLFLTSLMGNENLSIQLTLASNQTMVLMMTMTTMMKGRGPQVLEALLQPDGPVDLPEELWEAMRV
ncbi:uncharacterized protein FOMMEDRAFT_162944 [Fomitiporia mediterranea MF3/22]|uniref:Uncharacterized protein n=1 Tax=Fomitiporia mediterranea (strain MF3/22) TaxID=694068 RepID=R7SFP5_FOMME|nr:uncharacterized protein FOMMEDRAFT_162944 [Fomitiporia mediterranea MF3/22]EJC97533.1 hypothetical protein FOMMEDRAFT_162944 [Fomitiporia mediterranea MF3/22]